MGNKNVTLRARASAALMMLMTLTPRDAAAGKHISLFNGRSLAGWHTQGDCQYEQHNHYCNDRRLPQPRRVPTAAQQPLGNCGRLQIF